jgi:hypothetical protein
MANVDVILIESAVLILPWLAAFFILFHRKRERKLIACCALAILSSIAALWIEMTIIDLGIAWGGNHTWLGMVWAALPVVYLAFSGVVALYQRSARKRDEL